MRPGPWNNINNQLYQQFCRASPIQMWLISRRMAGSSQWTRILVKIHLHCCCIETQKFPQNDAMSNVAATICTTGWIVGHRTMHMLTGLDNLCILSVKYADVRIVRSSWQWTIQNGANIQGVPQLSIHFVLVVFSASSARTDVYFTLFQQPMRWQFQNSPYFPPYV